MERARRSSRAPGLSDRGPRRSAIRARRWLNHEWWKPETFVYLGTIQRRADGASCPRDGLSGDVGGLLNRAVVEHDVALVVGPVLPHEVVGMSGGNKYFFPGVAGQKIIDVSHWLGALITVRRDHRDDRGLTPVRALIDEGAALIPAERTRVLRRHRRPRRPAASALHSISFGDRDRVVGECGRGERAATHVTLPGRAGAAGAVAHPADVRRDLDGREGLLQGRTGGRGRR